MNKENLVYLYGVDELAGGEGLSTYDLTLIASKDFKWFTEAVDAFDDEEAA